MAQRVQISQIVATPDALEVMGELEVSPSQLLERHASGVWGDVPREDARENEYGVKNGFRVLSSYPLYGDGLDHHRGRPLLDVPAAAEQ